MEIEGFLSKEESDRFRRYKIKVASIIIILAALGFWTGVDFLKEDVFKNYFNPTRHVIIDQDPLTSEITMWKDSLGNIYTPENTQVKLFPYGIASLILIILFIAVCSFNLLIEHQLIMIALKRSLPQEESYPQTPKVIQYSMEDSSQRLT